MRFLPALLLCTTLSCHAQTIGDPLFADGFDLDPSVEQDRLALEDAHLEAMLDLYQGNAPPVRLNIRYVGKGQRVAGDAFEAPVEPPGSTVGAPLASFAAFNPASGNEFRIELVRADLDGIATETARRGRQGSAGPQGGPPPNDNPDAPIPGSQLKAWSQNSDNRVLRSSLTVGTTAWPWRTINEHSNRCSSTLIGPRHAVTAAHCLYDRPSNTWSTGFFVTPGRAGNNWSYGRSQIPSGSFTWYFTPAEWRQATPAGGPAQYDFGILVLPDRLGDQTGWMGYATLTNAGITNGLVFNRGFPWCNATDRNGVARIDDVGDDPFSGLVCNDRHLYGDASSCSSGNFQAADGDGWARLFDHSCDASAGHSGSAMYAYLNGQPAVIGIHTTSLCGKTATDIPCTATSAQPLRATRVTPEYRAWISYFRNWKP